MWIGFNCHKIAEPLRGDDLFLAKKSPGNPGTEKVGLLQKDSENWGKRDSGAIIRIQQKIVSK